MDFSIIEGLTEEELNELYNNSVIQDPDTAYAGACRCYHVGVGHVYFGHHNPTYSRCHGTHGFCGYCAMRDQVGTDARCRAWCTTHEQAHWNYFVICPCTERGGVYGAYWSTCSR